MKEVGMNTAMKTSDVVTMAAAIPSIARCVAW